MKVNAWKSVGDFSMSVDVEYDSSSVTDCAQAEKIVFACIGGDAKGNDEVTANAETR